ncbi:hypothetical protein GE21DRAFT_6365 [Neurospora crassa]|uniref:Uncharacterized protein n=1 Tax=Neurospora crassa (strain ATCC 24698 / 74-OR23-1A / CBS 708.71 / DSM 1257 / FGSC 987) TaxID=367110 RepID=Q7SA46_NEUCR|nr:hypothetical protein NCU07316 [Neurospora crassa OR74A]EAA33238.1 hypothetical protein NCU07316 [Neurospora crassa OR74A]KHE88747.1 hypothetical protein GE21DRAFT_6365 [Neurospora crassa]|eukprot:XP_962474.1 hypothetical protein NCU07316 [Neurospora crassa OR74A]
MLDRGWPRFDAAPWRRGSSMLDLFSERFHVFQLVNSRPSSWRQKTGLDEESLHVAGWTFKYRIRLHVAYSSVVAADGNRESGQQMVRNTTTGRQAEAKLYPYYAPTFLDLARLAPPKVGAHG